MKSLFPDELLDRIRQNAVVAVLTIETPDDAVPTARALLDGGVSVMELTLRTATALDSLQAIRKHVPEMIAGIGTVLRPDQVDSVIHAGAIFAVSPGLNPAVVRRALDRKLPFAPGVMTPSDIELALELGCRDLKFFPAEPAGGLTMLASLRAPFAHLGVEFIPLGGVSADNMTEYLRTPGVLAVGGSWLAKPEDIRQRNWTGIRQRAREARQLADTWNRH